MSNVYGSILSLLEGLTVGFPLATEVLQWFALAATLFVVAIPFIILYRCIRFIGG